MKKFRKAFCPNPSIRFDSSPLREIADEIFYVCDSPIYDDLVGDEHRSRFESRVEAAMENFDPETDILVFIGDVFIFSAMLFEAFSSTPDDVDINIKIARYSVKSNRYIVRSLTEKIHA